MNQDCIPPGLFTLLSLILSLIATQRYHPACLLLGRLESSKKDLDSLALSLVQGVELSSLVAVLLEFLKSLELFDLLVIVAASVHEVDEVDMSVP